MALINVYRTSGIYRDQYKAPVVTGWRSGIQPFLCSYSNWFLFCAFTVTLAAKLLALSRITGSPGGRAWMWALVASDALLCFGLAAVLHVIERRFKWTVWFTSGLGLLIFAASALSAAYLSVSGELLSWQSITVGIARFGDVRGIVSELMSSTGWAVAAAAAGVLLAVPYACRLRWVGQGSARVSGAVAATAAFVVLLAPAPGQVAWARLADNAVLAISSGLIPDDKLHSAVAGGLFGRYPTPVSNEAAAQWGKAGARPNVVMFVLESTRLDVTSLGGGPADTKTLQALAERGMIFQNVRAVMPHTTKSLWSSLCGQFPLMQRELYETSLSVQGQCLAHILGAGGYRRAFIQSAVGSFEDRPRLVANLGFEHFMAWEDIGGEPLGFLASDDESLTEPLLQFVDRDLEAPFLTVVLMSGTHYPYRLSQAARSRSRKLERPIATPRDRYARLVEAEDVVMADIMAGLSARGLLDNTIVVAFGDHGEGFGDQGVRQHDTNFFDEGLRVPLVMAGPGIAPRVVNQAASLLDLLPTLLDALDLPYESSAFPGRSHLTGDPLPSQQLFSCWFESRCRGYVDGARKIVLVPARNEAFAFDLNTDPSEKFPLALSREDQEMLKSVDARMSTFQSRTLPLIGGEVSLFGAWRCSLGEPCAHHKSPSRGVRAQ